MGMAIAESSAPRTRTASLLSFVEPAVGTHIGQMSGAERLMDDLVGVGHVRASAVSIDLRTD
jgi:hypothetical protein